MQEAMSIASVIYGLGISVSLTACLLFFLKAFYRATGKDVAKEKRPIELQACLDDRDRFLLNLQELDFDLAMKKIAQEDHEELRSRLRSQLANVVRQIEEMGVDPETSRTSDGIQ